ncbi:MAG: hypothetical protein FWC32_02030 [Firmicutes bacterium]|nr:hypothetical protein [Bacillota bacterium]
MTPRERFLSVLNGKTPPGRLPMVEWAAWWGDTVTEWEKQGLPANMSFDESLDYFGLDKLHVLWCGPNLPPAPEHGGPAVLTAADYESLRGNMFTDECIEWRLQEARKLKARHDIGEIIIRIWLDGFFFFPRRLFGIEPHLFAFYDQPELMLRMNEDLCDFNIRLLDALFTVLTPDFIGLAEDMSYNLGPMLSYEQYKTFILPFYLRLMKRTRGVKVLLDSDGDVTSMIPWMIEAGIHGVYPLERQAGVDIVKIREKFPEFILLGGYDKMVMSKDEAAMRAEFERLLPVMKSGYFIPSVDHQTPPGVSLENYHIYVRLFKEYCEKAVENGDRSIMK